VCGPKFSRLCVRPANDGMFFFFKRVDLWMEFRLVRGAGVFLLLSFFFEFFDLRVNCEFVLRL